MESRVALIVSWFGEFPEWFNLFARSVAANPIISYHIWTDTKMPCDAPNIHCHYIKFGEYCEMVSEKLNISFHPNHPYKLCDLKPFLPFIHAEEIADYEFVGFADIDLIYGNMQDHLLRFIDKIDFFSGHGDRVAGHFFFMRNTAQNRKLAFKIKNWKNFLTSKTNYGIDEGAFCDVVCPPLGIMRRIWHHLTFNMSFSNKWMFLRALRKLWGIFISPRKRFVELHSTRCALPPSTLKYRWTDTAWIYNGKTIMGKNNRRNYPYLHFLFLKTEKEIPCAPVWETGFYQVDDVNSPVIIDRKGIRNIVHVDKLFTKNHKKNSSSPKSRFCPTED